MPDFMKQTTAVKEAEERRTDRFERRLKFIPHIPDVYDALQCITKKLKDIEAE